MVQARVLSRAREQNGGTIRSDRQRDEREREKRREKEIVKALRNDATGMERGEGKEDKESEERQCDFVYLSTYTEKDKGVPPIT